MNLTETPARAEQRLTGDAIARLRAVRGLKQRHIAEALGMSTQAYQKHEAGERRFDGDKIAKILGRLGATEEDLDAMRAELLGAPPGVGERTFAPTEFVFDVYGRARAGPQGPEAIDTHEPLRRIDLRQLLGKNTDALEVAGDSMYPWAEPGEVVLFDRDRYPKRGAGCVIETNSGEAYVKLYEKSDGSRLFVRELYPEERTITFELRDVRGVYAVKLRGD